MSLQITFMGFAEGATFDGRGHLALVGFMPQAVTAESFPAQIAIHLIVLADDDDRNATLGNRKAHVRITATNEDGDVVFLAEQSPPLNDLPVNGMGPRLAIVANLPITAAKPGTYTYAVRLRVSGPDGEEAMEQRASLMVLGAEEVDQRKRRI